MDDTTGDERIDGFLLTRDLMFTSKVTGTAAALGLRIAVIGDLSDLERRVLQDRPRAVFVDLNWAELDPRDVLSRLTQQPRPVVIAFGSHVDVDRLELARQAGCDDVLPRSRFSATLPELLQQILVRSKP